MDEFERQCKHYEDIIEFTKLSLNTFRHKPQDLEEMLVCIKMDEEDLYGKIVEAYDNILPQHRSKVTLPKRIF